MSGTVKPGPHRCICAVCGRIFPAMRARATHCSIRCGNRSAYDSRRDDPARYEHLLHRQRTWKREKGKAK